MNRFKGRGKPARMLDAKDAMRELLFDGIAGFATVSDDVRSFTADVLARLDRIKSKAEDGRHSTREEQLELSEAVSVLNSACQHLIACGTSAVNVSGFYFMFQAIQTVSVHKTEDVESGRDNIPG